MSNPSVPRMVWDLLMGVSLLSFIVAGVVSAWGHSPHDYRDYLFVGLAGVVVVTILFRQRAK